jgi:Mor family transcriptional regulator
MQRVVRELVKAVGLGSAIQIVRAWGGREVYVPEKVDHGHPLALTLGLEPARKLVEAFGSQRLNLPAERNALIDLRNAAILERIQAGQSRRAVALEFCISRQMINYVVSRAVEREGAKFAGIPEDSDA